VEHPHFGLDPDRAVQLLAGKWEDATVDYACTLKGNCLGCWVGHVCMEILGQGLCVCVDGLTDSPWFFWAGHPRLCATFLLRSLLHSRTMRLWQWDDRIWYRVGDGMLLRLRASRASAWEVLRV
jgi:hypothetical protein